MDSIGGANNLSNLAPTFLARTNPKLSRQGSSLTLEVRHSLPDADKQ